MTFPFLVFLLIEILLSLAFGGPKRLGGRRTNALAGLLACALIAEASAITNSPLDRLIGIEGHAAFQLSRPDYRPRPLDDRTELILRIESIIKDARASFRYDFYYMGLEPGSYDLADYLIRPDGSRPDELAGLQVHVEATLPEDHNGQLTHYVPGDFPFIGGYRAMLGAITVCWLGGIGAFVWFARRKHAPVVLAPVVATPSFAERLRPLVEAAAAGQLSAEQQAQIERLLMGFWREHLNLTELRMAEVISHLREHAQAGELLRALERWLHQRTGASSTEINNLLEPYRHTKPPNMAEGPK